MKVFPIIDENEKRRLSSLAKAIADEPAHFSRTWLADKNWTVVPVESASHFDERDAERLARAFRGLGWGEIFAIATEPLDDFPTCFAVNASKEGLLGFSQICGHFNFLLLTADCSGVILCTVYDYYLVGGLPQFVSVAVGGDIKAAWVKFNEFADDPYWEGRLLRLTKMYSGHQG